MMGIKECACDEHWAMYRGVDSLYCIPEANVTLYIDYNGIELHIQGEDCTRVDYRRDLWGLS